MQTRKFVLAATVAAFSTPVAAQSADDEVILGDDIVVFGGARDERKLLETPNAVTVLGEDEIRRKQASNYEDLLGDVPGVTIGGGPRGISQEPNIRGFQDEQVVLRIDGARQNFNLTHRGRFFTDPEILKRVEVLRGGASSLFGSGALGGVILLDTKDASDILDADALWGGRVKVGFNSQGSEFLGTTTLAVQSGEFDALGFFSYRPMTSDLEDGDGNRILNSAIDSINGLVKLGYEPGDHRFEFSYQIYDDEGLTPPNANAAATATNSVNRELSYQTARAEWEWAPDNDLIDVSALLYFNDADVTENRVSDGRLDTTNYQTFGAELTNRTEIELGVPIRLTFGAEYYQDQQEATRNGVPRVQAPDATAQYAAVFAQGDIELTETLTLTPGVRFDYFSLDPSGAFQDRSDSEISPKLALQWRPTDSVQLWVSASQSFRAPSLTELYVTGTHFSVGAPFPIFFPAGVPFGTLFSGNNVFLPTPDLKPERANQIEIGGRLDDRDVMFDGDRLIFSANGYYARVDDYVDTVVTFIDPSTFVPGAFGAPGTVNGSTVNRNVDANLWGFEAEVTYDAPDFFLGAGVTIPRGGQRDGAQLGSIPQDRITLTGGFRPIDDLEIGARATLMSGQKRTASTPTSGTALFDLFATWTPTTGALDGAFVSAGIDNLTDRTYRIHGNGLNQPGIAFKASAGIEF